MITTTVETVNVIPIANETLNDPDATGFRRVNSSGSFQKSQYISHKFSPLPMHFMKFIELQISLIYVSKLGPIR
jgi:hypothetical protein